MTPAWYLVKTNWPQTQAKLPAYSGLGGDVWPLGAAASARGRDVHSAMERSRQWVRIGEAEELLCTDLRVAEEYFAIASMTSAGVWLLEVATASGEVRSHSGFDIGFPSGGFSLIETELITQSLPGPALNESGLIDTYSAAEAYSVAREQNEALEILDGVAIVAIHVMLRS